MSDTQQGPDWWQASDGRWYPAHLHPDAQPAATTPAAPERAQPPTPAAPPGPGWWQASDGHWYPPHLHPDLLVERAAPATGWRVAHVSTSPHSPGEDLIRTAVVKPPLRARVISDNRRLKSIGLIAAAALVVAGAGTGIAVAISPAASKTPAGVSTSTPSTVAPTTTVASEPVTSASAAALDLRKADLPAGWAEVGSPQKPQADMVPAGNCSFGRSLMLWVAGSSVFADNTGDTADEFAFDDVIVTPGDAGATAALAFASSATYQQTCLHPAVLDALEPYVNDVTVTKCTQPLNYAGDQIASGSERYASAPAFTIHWVGWYECPTNQQLVYFYVDEVIMAAGKSAVTAYFIGISAQPSGSLEWKAMSDLSVRAAHFGL